MPRWVFLDVGNVLLDEDPLTYFVFRRHVEAVQRDWPGRTFLELLAEREARASAGSRWPVFEVVSALLNETRCVEVWDRTAREVRERYFELSPVLPGAIELVDRLSRCFRLGLIANQGSECRARLAALGLLNPFEVIAFSEERGLSKPDPALFRWSLDQAGACPEECWMVGDRLDNDLAPAADLGLATAWVRWPDRSAKGWRPRDPEAVAYRDSLERSARFLDPRAARMQPTVCVDQVRQLGPALVLS